MAPERRRTWNRRARHPSHAVEALEIIGVDNRDRFVAVIGPSDQVGITSQTARGRETA